MKNYFQKRKPGKENRNNVELAHLMAQQIEILEFNFNQIEDIYKGKLKEQPKGFKKVIKLIQQYLAEQKLGFFLAIAGSLLITLGYYIENNNINLKSIFLESYSNLGIDLIGTAITVLVIDYIYRSRQERDYKKQLVLDVGGSSNEFAVRAAKIIINKGWGGRNGLLTDSLFSRAALHRVDFRKADLSFSGFVESDLTEASLEFVTMTGNIVYKGNLSNIHLDYCIMTESYLIETNLEGAHLNNALLSNCVLKNVNLSSSDLEDASFYGTKLICANLQAAKLEKANFSFPNPELSLGTESANLSGSDLRGAKFGPFTNMHGTVMKGVDLRNTNISFARLWLADLREADLRGAVLKMTGLNGANLQNANLCDADLSEARLEAIEPYLGTSFNPSGKVKINHAFLRDSIYNERTKWPKGFDPSAHGAKLIKSDI